MLRPDELSSVPEQKPKVDLVFGENEAARLEWLEWLVGQAEEWASQSESEAA